MILYVCYNDNYSQFPISIENFCSENFPEIKIEKYNENDYHERKKAFKLKGGFSARMTPFMLLLTDNNEYIKAFYSEDKGCTLEKLDSFLTENYNKFKEMTQEEVSKLIEYEINKILNPVVEIVTTNPLPSIASPYSAGYDLQADLWGIKEKFLVNTEISRREDNTIESLIIHPGGHALVPTGIYTAFSGNYRVEIVPRSGLALKFRITITNSPGTIEGDYKDEWGVIIDNEGSEDFIIKQGDRICQAIFSLIVRPTFVQKDSVKELSGSNRGGGFGHSGVNDVDMVKK